MTNNNGWSGKPGVPLNPEQSGWHWFVRGDFYSLALWHCGHFTFQDTTVWPEEFSQLDMTYAGPCLTPAEVNARIAAERDALRAEKVNLQDDLASVERERAHQHGRADRNATEIARLRAACDALEDRERAIELRFWQTVDRDGLTGLPSDMWAALEQLVRDRAAVYGSPVQNENH
jgi:hypothetical protein